MPDAITPVAAQVQPPNALGTMSSILGLQQQQQNLQTGALRQQEVEAESQQAQQRNSELQALGRYTANAAKDPSYLRADGTPDVQKFQQGAMAVGPVFGQQYIGQMTSNFTGAVENRKALLGLSNEQRATAANAFAAFAANPNGTERDFERATALARGASDDPAYQTAIDRMLRQAPPTQGLPTEAASQALRQYARTVAINANAVGTAQSNPNLAAVQLPQNVMGLVETNPQAVGGAGTIKGGVVGGAAPAQQPGFQGQVAAATTAASGQAGVDNQVFSRVMAAGANAQRGIELAQRVEQEAAGVRTGQYTQEFANRLTVLQQHDPSITARQLLQKDAANLKTLAEEGATTDAERNQIGGGFPSPETMDPDAVQKAARYWQGSFKMAGARRDNAVSHVSANGTAGLALSDAGFMKGASPGKYAPGEPQAKVVTKQDVQAYAQKHNLSMDVAMKHVQANGFTVQ